MRLRTQLLIGNLLVLTFLVLVAVIAYRALDTLVETGEFVSHTHQVQSEAHVIEKLLLDMETGERGFLIAGAEEFLEPYETGRVAYERAMADLRDLVSDNPPQVRRLDEIDTFVERWQNTAGSVEIEARREMDRTGGSIDQVANLIQQGTGKAIMDTLRDRLTAFIDIEGGRCCMKTLRTWGGLARSSRDPARGPHYRDAVEGPSHVQDEVPRCELVGL